jgi:hypothetical protein
MDYINVLLDIVLLAALIWMVMVALRGIGGIVGSAINLMTIGILILGLDHIARRLPIEYFNLSPDTWELTHRIIALTGFFLLGFGFRKIRIMTCSFRLPSRINPFQDMYGQLLYYYSYRRSDCSRIFIWSIIGLSNLRKKEDDMSRRMYELAILKELEIVSAILLMFSKLLMLLPILCDNLLNIRLYHISSLNRKNSFLRFILKNQFTANLLSKSEIECSEP